MEVLFNTQDKLNNPNYICVTMVGRGEWENEICVRKFEFYWREVLKVFVCISEMKNGTCTGFFWK